MLQHFVKLVLRLGAADQVSLTGLTTISTTAPNFILHPAAGGNLATSDGAGGARLFGDTFPELRQRGAEDGAEAAHLADASAGRRDGLR